MTRKQKTHALKIARKYTAIKIKLESPFKTELKSYFAEQTRRISRGQTITTIAPILDHHYRRIITKLTPIRFKQDADTDTDIENRILIILFGRAGLQAARIDSTTNKYLRRSIELARMEIAEAGTLFPSLTEINKISANIMRGYNKGRVGNIAVFETQGLVEKIRAELNTIADEMMETAIFEENQILAQEAADLAESQRLAEIADDIGEVSTGELLIAVKLLEKSWVTMGDKRVRPTHVQANFQTVPINDTYLVGGFDLMYPGDSSHGAPLAETSGCRCSSVHL